MSHYAVAREGATPVANETLLALTTAANEQGMIDEIFIGGEATSSTVNRMVLRRSTTNGTSATTQTPSEMDVRSSAALVQGATTWTTEPTTAAAPAIWTTALNVFGGVVRWVAAPGQELVIQGATAGNSEVSFESASGTGDVSCQIVFEEP